MTLHKSAYDLMDRLLAKHCPDLCGLRVLDVGSYDENGTHRPLVEARGGTYCGLDVRPGPNVDVVVPERGDWRPLAGRADVVISGQCLEHVRRPWKWVKQVRRVTAPGGLVVVVVPWSWDFHRFPVDCWRVLPDGMEELLRVGRLGVVEVGLEATECWGVGRRP